MKAIITHYKGPTNFRGARITATAEGGDKPHRVTIPYPYELDHEQRHEQAALALCHKMGWPGKLVGGGLPDGRGMAWVFLPSEA